MINRAWLGRWNLLAILAVALIVVSLLFGGASREHALRLAIVELAALPLIITAHVHYLETGIWSRHKFALGLLVAIVTLPLVQIIPLPPGVWTALPGRQDAALALELAGIEGVWTTLSLTPDETWRSFLALLPSTALFLAVLAGPANLPRRLAVIVIVLATIAIGLGMLQVSSGTQKFYPWTTTSAGSFTGFFANRNHLATLLLITLPFGAVFAGESISRRGDGSRLIMWLSSIYIVLVIVALAAIRSRAGVILVGPCLIGSFLVAWVAAGRGRLGPGLFALAGAATVAIGVVVALGLGPILERFDRGLPTDARFENTPIVAEAAQSYLPVGSGIGSFDAVFRSVEPLERLDATFFNQAHNEYLQLWLEAGWFGVAIIIGLLAWLAVRARQVWQLPSGPIANLQRAATVALFVVALHSIADYPLRTAAIAVLFAFCAAILERAAGAAPEASDRNRVRSRVRHPG